MNSIFKSALLLGVLVSSVALAEMRDLNSLLNKATPAEKANLALLLKQVTLVPANDPKTGKQILKVTQVEKGSFWDKQGLKVGDILTQ